jgi:sugar diacid utilization regulator
VAEADIQALVDGVAAELDAAVWLGDVENRLLAHGADDEVMDEVRRMAIMHRRLTPEVQAWFDQWGIRDATEPVRTPADTTLGILERWCLPVRFRGAHLGYMWVLGSRPIAESELKPAIEAAAQVAALLYRRRLVTQVDADLLRLLLTHKDETVAAEARAIGTYTHKGPVVVIAVGPAGAELNATELSDLALAVQRAAEQACTEGVLSGVILGLGILLAPLRTNDDLSPARRLAERVCRLATHMNHDLDVLVAIGGATELTRAPHSYAEARRALRMARAMPDLGAIVAWDDLGVFRALALLPPGEAGNGAVDRRVRELIADGPLADTAETFLDLAGDVQETATRLRVHRTTLYQRLDRIAMLYELDLRRSGDHRLITHLGLKLAHIAHA